LVCTTPPNVYLVTASNGTQACQPQYVDNGDGTVNDNSTGLMWEKKTGVVDLNFACQNSISDVHDVRNCYAWSATLDPFLDPNSNLDPTGTLYTDFLDVLNDLNTPNDGTATTCFAGHCDWRIPTIAELRSILTAGYLDCASSPCIDPAFGPTAPYAYWSSSSVAGIPIDARDVYFNNGAVGYNGKASNYYARAVRGGR
jgi:hypothetical protein